ncbi:MAG: hypothetical protein JW940_19575 [Polyangiaceae bacterium]|nr:hypothetical protein [Polyangiaceae bacterium]
MTIHSWALTDDLPTVAVASVLVLVAAGCALLALELRERERLGGLIVLSGIVAMVLSGAAVLRPVRITGEARRIGPRVVVLWDQSRRLLMRDGALTRSERARQAVQRLRARWDEARLEVLGFGEEASERELPQVEPTAATSNLLAALRALRESAERPDSLVVVSDGRLTAPGSAGTVPSMRDALAGIDVPIHTIRVSETAPADASIRSVHTAGVAVAHQPFELVVEVGCSGGLSCDRLPVAVRELHRGAEPSLLASGLVELRAGAGRVRLPVTVERAGSRVLEVRLDSPQGDQVPENDVRLTTFTVTRARVRLLHVAGRPSYDVRALRVWLKSDRAVDVVAFFILRSLEDDAQVLDAESELALIPFPVHELLGVHLPSFDAVILQDIDAVRYELAPHLGAIANYVRVGGGLIMVGGPSAFLGGSYGGTALDSVLPVTLPRGAEPFDTARFVPEPTALGRTAPIVRPLRELLGDELPEMVGSNTLGSPREGALVLWQHPTRRVALRAGTAPMPLLALTEAGEGRSIALGVDGTYRLAFSGLGAQVLGRAYSALYDGLLGWLMRDPRYESARVELDRPCVAHVPFGLPVFLAPGLEGPISLKVSKLSPSGEAVVDRGLSPDEQRRGSIELGGLETGGYCVELRVGRALTTRYDFACEAGGEAWSDSRPDPERLKMISRATGGRSVSSDRVEDLPRPEAAEVHSQRHVKAVLPPWCWCLLAASALSAHWALRRRGGLS